MIYISYIFGDLSSEMKINFVLSRKRQDCECTNALLIAVFAYTVLVWLRNVVKF